jgi:hypothetical protein
MDAEGRRRTRQVVENLLADRIGCLSATRALLPYLHANPETISPEDFKTLKGIDSETDDLPIGIAREQWHPDALLQKESEIARCEKLYASQVREICERLRERLELRP